MNSSAVTAVSAASLVRSPDRIASNKLETFPTALNNSGIESAQLVSGALADDAGNFAPSLLDDATFSPLARLIAAASRDDHLPRGVLTPATIPRAERQLALGHRNPTEFAQAMQAEIESSGLFYESHLAEWIDGRRSLGKLLCEPQAQPGFHDRSDDGSTSVSSALVREQLQALQASQLALVGPIWPGQEAYISLGQQPSSESDRSGRIWCARLRLDLPTLGRIDVEIQLRGADLAIKLVAASGTGRYLACGEAQLAARLRDCGLRPRAHIQPMKP